MNWNLIFRKKLRESSLHKRLHNSLMDLTLSGKINNPECFLKAWLLMDFKQTPQVFMFNNNEDSLIVLIGYRALPQEYTLKEQMLWKCVILTQDGFEDRGVFSPLDTKLIVTKEYTRINDKVLTNSNTEVSKWLPHNHHFGYLGLRDFKVIEYKDNINFGPMYPIHRSDCIYITGIILKVLLFILGVISISLYFQIRHHSLGFLGNYPQYVPLL